MATYAEISEAVREYFEGVEIPTGSILERIPVTINFKSKVQWDEEKP